MLGCPCCEVGVVVASDQWQQCAAFGGSVMMVFIGESSRSPCGRLTLVLYYKRQMSGTSQTGLYEAVVAMASYVFIIR